ncbi:hypothetical protein PGT21_020081 [Puccinia graminis f. sp. tritici]|uniref:hAT-like transposase RNase-H fold domain-containing protein n=1 Tax=Puccinia graminis f. sp. tritici TaxID=56615 RepID=A0A5B0RJE4_PUCGR|nr:hypothetical protein PGT21_020081 [Puccinia graminis f. sp. tritici]KAA1125807.1 hypothetical protein PGTUg99_022731 [Puccinia graminis f. sp. tritici]
MAKQMCNLLVGNKGYQPGSWDPTSIHIRCFCHKLALIVNAGLQALSLKTLPPKREKASVLGFFPVLGKMVEEDEQDLSVQDLPVDVKGAKKTSPPINLALDSDRDYGNADNENSDKGPKESDENNTDHETTSAAHLQHAKTTKLKELTKELDVVIKQITRSAAQRSNFDLTTRKLNFKVAPLIAGYGIRWNICYQSHCKAIEACEVIDQILKDNQQHNSSEIFSNAYFSLRD